MIEAAFSDRLEMDKPDKVHRRTVNIDVESVDNIAEVEASGVAIDETSKKRLLSSIWTICLLVCLWYATAVAAITSTKMIMNILPFPFLLCTFQFVIASIITAIYRKSCVENGVNKVDFSADKVVEQIAMSYTLGFVFTNISFSIVNANFAETVKAGEPISSVIIGYLLYNEKSSMITYLTLVPLCVGVAISSVNDISFDFIGFLTAAISNICFSSRAVLSRHLFKNYPGYTSEISMFERISLLGLMLLLPAFLIIEARTLLTILFGNIEFSVFTLLCLFLLNGIMYTAYNITSFLVLSRTSLVTHAVLNVFRRVVIIIFTAFFFDIQLSMFNILGVFLAISGVLSYTFMK